MIEPLTQELVFPKNWKFLFPGLRTRYKINSFLLSRQYSEVRSLWQNENIEIDKIECISKIVKDCACWKNHFFIPDDNFRVLIADYNGMMNEIFLFQSLNKAFEINSESYEIAINSIQRYADFIRFVLQFSS